MFCYNKNFKLCYNTLRYNKNFVHMAKIKRLLYRYEMKYEVHMHNKNKKHIIHISIYNKYIINIM